MQKTGKIFFTVALLIFVPFMWVMIQTFRPVRNVQPKDVLEIKGKVSKIEEGSGFDIVITIENDSHYYYINRGLQSGLTLEELRADILNKNVTLYPVRRWTMFTRDGIMGHISKLMIGDRILFNEIIEDPN